MSVILKYLKDYPIRMEVDLLPSCLLGKAEQKIQIGRLSFYSLWISREEALCK